MLTILHLDNNQLTQIPLSLPSNLMKLFIQANHIADIRPDDLANLNNLELLDLSNNRIIYMPQLALPSLITLSVKMNELENVQHQMLKTCPNLRHLFNVGNPIKCAELLEFGEICIDDSQQALNNKYINDDIDYNQDDLKREEKHLNSQSYFHRFNVNGKSVSGLYRCQRQRRRNGIKGSNFTADADVDGMETLPNCWSEKEKLITPLIFTNDSTSSKIPKTTTTVMLSSSTTTTSTTTRREETALLNDNKFIKQEASSMREKSSDDKIALSNDEKLSNNITTSTRISMTQTKDNYNDYDKKKNNVKTKNGKSLVTNDKIKSSKVTKKDKLGVNVANKEIKRLNDNSDGMSLSNNSAALLRKNKQKESSDVMQKHLTVDEVSSLMKSNQIKTNDNDYDGRNGNHSHTRTLIAQIENPQLVASEKAINRNLIDNVHRKGGNENDNNIAKSTTLVIQSKSELIPTSTNKIKAIKDNDGRSLAATKSIDNVHTPPAKMLATGDNKSNNEQPLQSIITSIAEGKKKYKVGNEGILEATDHHHQQQHSPINHSMEKWNDVRSESINHPGLFVVITVSVGFFFIFTLVYVYRCDFINSARRRRHGRNGSFESINEGRDVLNDNFNEETRSFTIESYGNNSQRSSIMIHHQQQQQQHNQQQEGPNVINQNDLLPMDILNSSINSSTLDPPPHISMHLW
jgi:hypothetical protein